MPIYIKFSCRPYIQGNQLNMAVFFLCLGKSDLYSVHVVVDGTSQFKQGTRKTRPCLTGHPLVRTL